MQQPIMLLPNFSSISACWAWLALQELYRLGVEHVCVAPGSRSAPLILQLPRVPQLQVHVHPDERGLGFFALGLAKACERPVAIITTSGTAVANLLPAVVEAAMTHTPLILLTADRPPELLACGANQAIHQPGIFSSYLQYEAQLPVPTVDVNPAFVLSTIDVLVAKASVEGHQGPVHLNWSFREPLYSDIADHAAINTFSADKALHSLKRWLISTRPFTHYAQLPASVACNEVGKGLVNVETDTATLIEQLITTQHGILVLGAGLTRADVAGIMTLAEQLQWPVLADIQAIGLVGEHPLLLPHHSLWLSHPAVKRWLDQASLVLQFGSHLVAKALLNYLQHFAGDYWLVASAFERYDPSHQVHLRLQVIPEVWCKQFNQYLSKKTDVPSPWLTALQQVNEQLRHTVLQQLPGDNDPMSALAIPAVIKTCLPVSGYLFAGNSMAIRLLDAVVGTRPDWQLFANRGASGIDGLLATAAGVAQGAGQPVTLFLGDLSLLHDLNSLLLLKQLISPLIVIVLNDDGGGIFHHFPLTEQTRQDYFTAAHGVHFQSAAKLFSLDYCNPKRVVDFKRDYQAALNRNTSTLIEINTANAQAYDQLQSLNKSVEVCCDQWFGQSEMEATAK
ncbi:2-succinyl-5-enolpyruvyl-6-hydroxy-3-cyclohexene-1-carboxylic-acid synthase [Zooshikella harenae]|uniref:2-succinyl-5-enolpyruvyl-6-hydroxy-3-cyclohexene-1-carboxylate synthase n=1 Tax=Zooshikella harenae TaxID=2827238 RepID=A0ABS5ZEZ7_9GAMM|nr:2-succinyl-5-enolpyruvyl-6-hydroxy-3-cyclohexene-1-carboxylic-acid synthase [Zooshikella harenae]MBU2712643.1 2-succinyl-5-enolpyruvyl-6-hydroxy-3-cyclohexene-1-carboxylic-acid synthase [Zooshikella harenae]